MSKRNWLALLGLVASATLAGSCAPSGESAAPAAPGSPGEPGAAANSGACSDGKDNDGDGLVDWQFDLGCYGPGDDTEGGLATRELDNGWSVFEPSADTMIIYVSSSSGSDDNRGTSPDAPKRTLLAARDATRDDYPDWILLKRGDTWFENIQVRFGRSRSEPFIIATYGDSTARPILKTGAGSAVRRSASAFNDFVVMGINFYAHTRDFDSPSYTSTAGKPGFDFYTNSGTTNGGILFEDCWFDFYTGNVIQGDGVNEDIVIRRNVFSNNYTEAGHSAGIYSKNTSILLEENVFDHNGWYMQQIGDGNDSTGGQATVFNHNTYFVNQKQTTFRRNLFLRPSSMNNKWTAQDGPGSTADVVIDNNLYVDGEIGIGIGGNDQESPYRFENVTISNNVLLDIGRSRPTNRNLGWYLDVDDWDGGSVSKNLFLHQRSTEVPMVWAIKVNGVTRNVRFEGNVIHGLYTNRELVSLGDDTEKRGISFVNNTLQSQIYRSALIAAPPTLTNYSFSGNRYYSTLATDQWFEAGGARGDINWWNTVSGTIESTEEIAFPDASRSIETYQEALGKTPTIEAFVAEALQQSKYYWRPDYSAAAINDWMRAGFVP